MREWGGLGGHPPFEEVTSTPGVGVGGWGGHPPFEEAVTLQPNCQIVKLKSFLNCQFNSCVNTLVALVIINVYLIAQNF